MNIKKSASFLLALAVSGCVSAGASARKTVAVSGGSRPAWVEGESPEFPRSRFVLGVGSADDDGSAGDRARGEVARVFSVDVAVNTSVDQSETGGDKGSSFSSSVSDQVRTATRKVLEGVDVVARWKDSSTGRYYALAALDKAHALLTITEKAHDIDGEAATYKARLAAATDPFERAKAAAKLLTLAKARTGLEDDSRVLGGGSLAGDFDAAGARADAAKALAALDVVVSVTGEGADAVEIAVVSGLNAVGLTAKRGQPGDKGDLVASAETTVAPQDAGDARWKRSRASASVTLQDGRARKTFARFDESAREDAVDPSEARRRSLSSLAKKTAEKITAAINDFFANQ